MPINMDKFKTLPTIDPSKKSRAAKISTEVLLEALGKEAMTTKEVSAFCEVQTGSAHTRLTKLEEKGAIIRRQGEGVQYWGANPDYVPPDDDEVENESKDDEF